MFRQVSQQREALQPAPTDRRLSSTSTTTINRVRDTSRTDTPITDGREQGVGSSTRRPSVPRREQPQSTSFMRSPPLKEEDLSSSSEESDSEEETSPRRFPRWRNFGKYSEHQSRAGIRDDEDDDDDAPAFLPMPRHEQLPREHPSERVSQELSGTLRLDADQASAVWPPTQRRPVFLPTDAESSASSTGMSSASSTGPNHPARGDDRRAPLRSPRSGGRATEQSRASPRSKGGVNGSDGTPSMGSSFSDLDGKSGTTLMSFLCFAASYLRAELDTSVTQSALEEALMSNMQQGGMASRMSTISQALRSRYLQ